MTLFFLMINLLQAANFTGDLFELGSGRKNKLFTYERVEKAEGGALSAAATYKNPDGSIAVAERIKYDKGELTSYELDQKQTGASGKVEFKDGKLKAVYKIDGKEKSFERPINENLIISPMITSYLRKNWTALLKGDTVKAELFVLDRGSTYSFEYAKVDLENKDKGPSAANANSASITIRMKPGNFLVAQLVDPLYFTFTADGERLLGVDGRALPKKKDGSSWKDVSVESVYHY